MDTSLDEEVFRSKSRHMIEVGSGTSRKKIKCQIICLTMIIIPKWKLSVSADVLFPSMESDFSWTELTVQEESWLIQEDVPLILCWKTPPR